MLMLSRFALRRVRWLDFSLPFATRIGSGLPAHNGIPRLRRFSRDLGQLLLRFSFVSNHGWFGYLSRKVAYGAMGAAGVPQIATRAKPLSRRSGSSALGLSARNISPRFTLHQLDVKNLFVHEANGTSEAEGASLKSLRLINEGKELIEMLHSKDREGVHAISTEPFFRETSPV